jgi:hypothetical protein
MSAEAPIAVVSTATLKDPHASKQPKEHVTVKGRPKHSSKLHGVKGAGAAKKGGAGGKGVWGKPGDELKFASDGAALDRNDPNYDEYQEAVVVAGTNNDDGDDGAYDSFDDTFFKPSQEKFSASIEDFAKFKKQIRAAALEYISSLDVKEFMRQIKDLGMPLYNQEITAIVIKGTLERSSNERAHIHTLLQACSKLGLLSSAHVAHSFTKLYSSIDELLIDCPSARTLLEEFIKSAVDKGFLEQQSATQILDTDKALNSDPKQTLKIKSQLKTAITEFLANPNDQDIVTLLRELKAPYLHFEFIKTLFSKAMDKENSIRERASLLLPRLIAEGILERAQIERGFETLLQRVEDLFIDVPDVLRLLSSFLARAVVDECVTPAFLTRQDLVVHDMGFQVVRQAKRLLDEKGAGEKLSRVWVSDALAQVSDGDVEADATTADWAYEAKVDDGGPTSDGRKVPETPPNSIKLATPAAVARQLCAPPKAAATKA